MLETLLIFRGPFESEFCRFVHDIGHGRRNSDLNTRVSLLSQLALEELVQLSIENTVYQRISNGFLSRRSNMNSYQQRTCDAWK